MKKNTLHKHIMNNSKEFSEIESPGFLGKWRHSIFMELSKLALPVIGSSILSMAYNFIDMIYVGKLGSSAVSSVGSAGFYLHMGWAIASLLTTGVGIKTSHSVGKADFHAAKSYAKSAQVTIFFMSLIYLLIIITGKKYLIGFFNLNNPVMEKGAIEYLLLGSFGMLFAFQNYFYQSVLTGYGDTKTSFRINSTGIITNLILDPVLIFILGWGIKGAAVATIISQVVVTILFYKHISKLSELRPKGINFRRVLLKQMLGLGVSPALQNFVFISIAIVMARIISNWGGVAIAVQKIGVQIEAISYMGAGGFGSALSTISGQAFGAGNFKRQLDGYVAGLTISIMIGLVSSTIFLLFPETVFSIFINDTESLLMGKEYLTILGLSQVFMCVELVTRGAFYGWGRTNIPAIVGIVFTALRIPMALVFIYFLDSGLTGAWWSISISSIAKGIILSTMFIVLFNNFSKANKVVSENGN